MKQILFFLFCLWIVPAMAQMPISNVNITMGANPRADVSTWPTTMPQLMITAQAQMRNGQVPGEVQESKILVTIKMGGSKRFGSYTEATAPNSNFNIASKSWKANEVVSLLGGNFILTPGTYELCVQYFGRGATAAWVPLSMEVCKSLR